MCRIFLGIFEATIGPSLMLISSQWYTKSEQAPRFSFWYLGLGLGQIVGGVVSFAFQHIGNAPIEGWRIMFIVLGIVSVIIGAATFIFLPDTPMKARFLSEDEKITLLKHVSVNQTGIHNSTFRGTEIKEALLDVQLWLLTLMVVLVSNYYNHILISRRENMENPSADYSILIQQSVSSGVVTTYSSTLIKNLGFLPTEAALLNTPSGIVSIFFTLLVGFGIRHSSHRWAWVFMCSIPGIIGGALMSFLPESNTAGLLIGIYLVNAIVAPLPVIYHWTAANCAGYTKRAFASATVAGSFSIGNIIGPQTFQDRDAPEYRPAKIAVLATQAAAGLMAVVLYMYYMWENKRRDARDARSGSADSSTKGAAPETGNTTEVEAWGGMTDKENLKFRYVY